MKNQDGIKYLCLHCHFVEVIPQDAFNYVNTMDPERCLIDPPSFLCEKYGYPYMMPNGFYQV